MISLVHIIIIKDCLLYKQTIKFILHDTYPCHLNTYHLSFFIENKIILSLTLSICWLLSFAMKKNRNSIIDKDDNIQNDHTVDAYWLNESSQKQIQTFILKRSRENYASLKTFQTGTLTETRIR